MGAPIRRPQVYVKQFPNGAKVQIWNDGGNDPVWRRDGRELFAAMAIG